MVACGQVSLHAREWTPTCTAAATPIVLVHGLASNARLWDGAAASLSSLGYRVIAVDQRGHGLSDKPNHGYDMGTVADDLAAFISALGLTAPIVAGQSWGGNVVIELADRHPGRIAGVCAVDGGAIQLADRFPNWDTCAQLLRPPSLAGMSASDFERMIRRAQTGWPESAVQGTLANMEILGDGTIRPWLTLERHMEILRGLWNHRPVEAISRLRRNVLFTPADHGDDHSSTKRSDYAELSKRFSHVRVEWFSPAHHDLHAQFPERWATTLHSYIERGFFT